TDVDPDPDNNEDDGGGGDAMAPVASISVAPAVVTEDGGVQLVYTITFAQAPAVDTVVNLAFAGTATAGTDYTGQIGSILVPAGLGLGAPGRGARGRRRAAGLHHPVRPGSGRGHGGDPGVRGTAAGGPGLPRPDRQLLGAGGRALGDVGRAPVRQRGGRTRRA